MIHLLRLALLAGAAFGAAAGATAASNQIIQLDSGEYRWWPVHVREAPAEVECHFRVLKGGSTVHAELLPRDEFRAFIHRRNYEKLTATGNARDGSFNQILPEQGDYAIVIVNEKNAPGATVSLSIGLTANPTGPGIARTLPRQRRLAVILISFAIFFVSVGWSGHRLVNAMKNGDR